VGRRMKDGLRAGATALGVAAGFMALASTAQTPDGFVHASFDGPLGVFGQGTSEVIASDEAAVTNELAALLKSPVVSTGGVPDSPYRAAFEAGVTAGPTAPNILPSPTAAAVEDAALLPSKPVVDAQGRVDCTGAVSCKTDPVTNVTTVTYPDGVVAVVQKINDLTVVAYKTLTEHLPPVVQQVLPSTIPTVPPPAPSPPPAPILRAPGTLTIAPPIDPGPPAPESLGPATRPGPRINVTRPPMDFSPGADSPGSPATNGPRPNPLPNLDKVKDALDSVVKSVTDAVGKAVNPGAAENKTGSGDSGSGPR
jgi:hypothetical protein